ncbi:hypothetical protein [Variovorax sp. KK3]|uniref:hypothetical protein n=1 Tax=Variovorax sp. KK3 TaxID=1855728 RepID=UPI00097BAA73|nr:hypothetical protein [Variovorax sp. KK3]
MEIHWTDGALSLQRPEDFKAFKVVIHAAPSMNDKVMQDFDGTARFEGDQVCWVSQQALRGLAGALATPQWLENLDAMVSKARSHGWIDDATGDIRAHVERA